MNRLFFPLICFLVISACNSDTKNTDRILGFKLPSEIKKVDRGRKSNYNPTGDGTLFIEYSFDDHDKPRLIAESLKNGFSHLPVNEKVLTDGAIFQYINRDDTLGYYKLNMEKDGISYSIGIIDLSRKKVYIYEALY